MRGNWALITGATAGFGLATAELLAERGCHLILTGRREERLKALAAKLAKAHAIEVCPLVFDIQDSGACEKAVASVANQLKNLSILINNAGLAKGAEPLPRGRFADWEAMIDTNVKGLLYMTRLMLPSMMARGEGHIVNLGSVAGRWTYPGGGVYCATKFAVRAISEALRMDLMGKNIRVSNIEPGAAETEFSEVRFNGDKEKADAMYRGMTPLTARDVAESVVWCLERPKHVNIQELVIFPTDQAAVGPSYTHRK